MTLVQAEQIHLANSLLTNGYEQMSKIILNYLCFKAQSLKKEIHEFNLTEEYIELIKLLKLMGVVDSGSDAKQLVDDGEVKVNNTLELRKRAKLRSGDLVMIGNITIRII